MSQQPRGWARTTACVPGRPLNVGRGLWDQSGAARRCRKLGFYFALEMHPPSSFPVPSAFSLLSPIRLSESLSSPPSLPTTLRSLP